MRILGRAAVVVAILALVTLAATVRGQLPSGDHFATASSMAACEIAAERFAKADSPSAPDAAAALRVLQVAGVTNQNAAWLPSDCKTVWVSATLRSAGIYEKVIDTACPEARSRLQEGEYGEAVALLSTAGVAEKNLTLISTECALTWKLTQALRRPQAEPKAIVAHASVLACALAARKLRSGEAADAVEILAAAGATDTNSDGLSSECRAVWTIATELTPADEPANKTAMEVFGKWWDDFVKTFAVPLATMGLFVLGGWLALFVLARLLVELPAIRDIASARTDRLRAARLGWGLLLASPVAIAAIGAVTAAGALDVVAAIIAIVLVAVLGGIGAVALACWLSTMLKLQIKVGPDEKVLSAARVADRLRLLSGEKRALEIPTGPSVAEVTQALTEVSEARWIAALQRIVAFLVGVIPWQANVQVTNDREASLLLTRNGRISFTRLIRTSSPFVPALDAPPPPATQSDILATFVASWILMGLRPAYAEDFSEGMDGAQNAIGIALQHIAVTWYLGRTDVQEGSRLLRVAVAADPYNRLAAASLQRALHRHSTDVRELLRYGRWVDRQLPLAEADSTAGTVSPLTSGLNHTRNAIARNLAALVTAAPDSPGSENETVPGAPEPPLRPYGGKKRAWETALASAQRSRASLVDARTARDDANAAAARAEKEAERPDDADSVTARRAAKKAADYATETLGHAQTAQRTAQAALEATNSASAWWFAAWSAEACSKAGDSAKATAAERETAVTAAVWVRRRAHRGAVQRFLNANPVIDVTTTDAGEQDRVKSAGQLVDTSALQGLAPVLPATDTTSGTPALTEQSAVRTTSPDAIRRRIDAAGLKAAIRALEGKSLEVPEVQTTLSGEKLAKALIAAPSDRSAAEGDAFLSLSLACYLVRWRGVNFGDPYVSQLLDTVISSGLTRAFALLDPELSTSHDRAGFARFAGRIQSRTAAEEAARKIVVQPKPKDDAKVSKDVAQASDPA